MAEPGNPHLPPDLTARLQRLEEHAGFNEHTVEQLSEEIRVLNARVRELTKRIEGLEGRLGGVADRVEKVEEQRRSADPPPTGA
jgi:uncharacterized coiled-coil protein SlyX